MSKSYTKEQIEKLKSELKTVTEERDYLKQCCIDAGTELSKHSFKWDGKEKNLVVQALQLNEMYEELEKQIELIKWLSKRRLLNVIYSKDKNTYHLFNDRCIGAFCYDIATAIVTLVQCELDFCTEEEKQQIKEILE